MASVPVDERTKVLLDQLRDEIERETGRDVSHGQLLERIVEREYESRRALVDSFREDDDFDGLSEEEIERFLSGTSDWGEETTEDEIDEILYEEEVLTEFEDE